MSHHPIRLTSLLAAMCLCAGALATVSAPVAHAGTISISKASYLDKTLAGILGQVGGVVTGYEFASPNPYPTDDCFRPTYGPYSGDAPAACWTPNGYPGFDRVGGPNFAVNEVGSDDDYHIDFFNQHILANHGPNPTFQDIKDEWVAHNVSDWGPGDFANNLMRTQGYLPPFTGMAEYDQYYWLTEGYIENDTLGMVAPGMPATARDLTAKFASVTTDYDSIAWAKFMGTMYSLAYFATDARNVLSQASVVLPRNGWPYQVYLKSVALYGQNPTDWRWAQNQLLAFSRNVFGQDNAMAIPDRNMGSLILSILYGNNDYLTTLKIASLIGNDGDCTASEAAGLMGIIKGMAGTPQEFKDRIYQNGAGRYINDATTGYPPYIRQDYPRSQSWDDIAALYQSNAAAQIVAAGGSQDATSFYVNAQTVAPEATILINNADFEQGSLAGWSEWTPTGDPGTPNAFAEKNGTAQSGDWKGTVFTDSSVAEIKLLTTIRGLQSGATYRVSAYVQSDQAARLYVINPGGTETYSSVVGSFANVKNQWVERQIDFTATSTTAEIGLHMPTGPTGFASIDNVTVEQITQPAVARFEAEAASLNGGQVRTSATASGGSYVGGIDNPGNYVQFSVTVPAAGEFRASVSFANGTAGTSILDLAINGVPKASIPFPRTEAWGQFSANIVDIPVALLAGSNTIRLSKPVTAGGYVEVDSLVISQIPQPMYTVITEISVPNGDFESSGATQNPANWGTWAGSAGTSADADYTESDGFSGAMRLTHAKSSAYEVYTDQTITLANGTYTLTAWAEGGGGQASAFLSVKNYGTNVPELTAPVPGLGYPQWRRISISGITVTNGTLTIGAYSNASAGQWMSLDAIQLWRQ